MSFCSGRCSKTQGKLPANSMIFATYNVSYQGTYKCSISVTLFAFFFMARSSFIKQTFMVLKSGKQKPTSTVSKLTSDQAILEEVTYWQISFLPLYLATNTQLAIIWALLPPISASIIVHRIENNNKESIIILIVFCVN